MAEISCLQLHDPNDAVLYHHRCRNNHHHHHLQDLTLTQIIDSLPYWSHPEGFELYASDTEFQAAADVSIHDSIVPADGLDLLDRHNFVMDLFQQRVELSQVTSHDDIENNHSTDLGFGVIEGNCLMGVDSLEVDLGLGLEFDGLEGNNCGFIGENVGDSDIDVIVDVNANDYDDHDVDDFFVERRVPRLESRDAASTINPFGNNIRVIGIGLDSEDDEHESENSNERDRWGIDLTAEDEYVNDEADDDASVTIPFFWDSLHLEDRRETNEDFEWEEVDNHVVDEREVLSVFAEADNEDGNPISILVSSIITPEDTVSGERAGGLGNLGWEVLLNSRNFETGMENNIEPYLDDHDDYIHTTEYEMLFEQFAEVEISMMGRPPASKAFVKNLPLVVLTKEDIKNDSMLCAVCKDGMNVGEKAAQLTCTHRYHSECIMPWLGIRNTCPVCRHELPTDDAEYERRKRQRAARSMQL